MTLALLVFKCHKMAMQVDDVSGKSSLIVDLARRFIASDGKYKVGYEFQEDVAISILAISRSLPFTAIYNAMRVLDISGKCWYNTQSLPIDLCKHIYDVFSRVDPQYVSVDELAVVIMTLKRSEIFVGDAYYIEYIRPLQQSVMRIVENVKKCDFLGSISVKKLVDYQETPNLQSIIACLSASSGIKGVDCSTLWVSCTRMLFEFYTFEVNAEMVSILTEICAKDPCVSFEVLLLCSRGLMTYSLYHQMAEWTSIAFNDLIHTDKFCCIDAIVGYLEMLAKTSPQLSAHRITQVKSLISTIELLHFTFDERLDEISKFIVGVDPSTSFILSKLESMN